MWSTVLHYFLHLAESYEWVVDTEDGLPQSLKPSSFWLEGLENPKLQLPDSLAARIQEVNRDCTHQLHSRNLEGGHEAKAVFCIWLFLVTTKIVEKGFFPCNSFHNLLSSFWESRVKDSGDNASSGCIWFLGLCITATMVSNL